jgi:hypothetical protein
MADIVNAIGDQAGKAISSVNPVNIVNYSIIPGVIVGILVLVIMIFMGIPLSGTSKVNECTTVNGNETCKEVDWSNKKNIVFYIICPLVVGLIAGGAGYKIGFMINNPVLGTAIMGASIAKDALSN